jgi:two-component system sensor histidine kinase KdpD
MSRVWSRVGLAAACIVVMWGLAGAVFIFLPRQDAVAAMLLLVGVLAVSATGDRMLAGVGSVAAGLAFSYYFIDSVGSVQITSPEGLVTFLAMLITAVTASELSLRVQLRAQELERRRSEMSRLQQLGAALLYSDTVSAAADRIAREIARLFGGAVVLTVEGIGTPFRSGAGDLSLAPLVVHTPNGKGCLELLGASLSIEARSALANLVGLVLERAAAAERQASIESMRRGDEVRTTILNALAHSFRTPLTCIKAAASMLRSSESGGADAPPATCSRELIEVIDEEADRLDDLLRDSLDTARIHARQNSPRIENCAFSEILSAVLKKMQRYLSRNSVILNVSVELPVVRGDRFLFEQMLTQVLDNAWKYSVAGARIWISAEQAGDEVILSVGNEGYPIPDEEQALIFDRFYRGARHRAGVEGTGLGLAIARTIAEAHGGRVWLEQRSEGPTFLFALPAGGREEEHDRESYCTVN